MNFIISSTFQHIKQYKGFPKTFSSRVDLVTFLTRFMWLPVKHAANSYPLVPYGAYIPVAPTKLYSDPEAKKYSHNLPNIAVTMVLFYQSLRTCLNVLIASVLFIEFF